MPANLRTVLMVIPKGNARSQDVSGVVRELFRAKNWELFSAEVFRTEDGEVRLARSSRSAESLPELVDLLRPDCMIVWTDPISREEARAFAGRGVPIAFVELTPDSHGDSAGPVGFIYTDPTAIAALATRTLLRSGFDDFAYVPYAVPTQWSRQRCEAFAHCVALAGKRFRSFSRPSESTGTVASSDALGRWLDSLPKPCAIFAANDVAGEETLVACAERGIRVPEEVAVLAVDDISYICESTVPTLSSISVDLVAEGRETALMVAELIEAKAGVCLERTIPPRAVSYRASTGVFRDRRLASACEFIRLNALREGFGPRDVVRQMGVSRTLADKIFRTFAGHTILDEIHAVRLARARDLLSAGKSVDFTASACGYSSTDDFRRVFRLRVGLPVGKWVASNRV